MILILSSDGDYSTEAIIKWLKNRRYDKFIVLKSNDFINNSLYINPVEGKFIFNGVSFDFSSINVVWYRRFGRFSKSKHYYNIKKDICLDAAELLKFELNNITELFISLIPKHAYFIGSPSIGNTNKLIELTNAHKAGLDIPHTIITNKKDILEEFIHNESSVISKSAYNARTIAYERSPYTMFTTRIDYDYLNTIPDRFFPSMVQKEISKEIEIRVFYFLEKIYSMAIISQNNPNTKIDYRRYDEHCPNRFLPCELNENIEEKIRLFMKLMKLNIGSLDFIKGTDGKFYFLEVNHMGQFGMVDNPCNYGIHRTICDTLIEKDLQTKNIRSHETN